VWRLWSPFSFLESSAHRYVLSLLNQPIADHAFFLRSPMFFNWKYFHFFPSRKVNSCLVFDSLLFLTHPIIYKRRDMVSM
jgi:hypothetical protein